MHQAVRDALIDFMAVTRCDRAGRRDAAHYRHGRLLRVRGERPYGRDAEPGDELPPSYPDPLRLICAQPIPRRTAWEPIFAEHMLGRGVRKWPDSADLRIAASRQLSGEHRS